MPNSNRSSILPAEIARFSQVASAWWNPNGALRSLHRLNPSRMAYLRDQIVAHGLASEDALRPFATLKILDVGCGAGLLSEPMARLGASVTGLDASNEVIAEARRHAGISKLSIDYRLGSAEALAKGAERYDVVTALEIVEHVADIDGFLAALSKLLKPKGLLILSTLNRTPTSFLLGIVAAEYVLRWVPKGTHRWSQFLRPSELVNKLDKLRFSTVDLTGVVFDPIRDEYRFSKDNFDINYFITAKKDLPQQEDN